MAVTFRTHASEPAELGESPFWMEAGNCVWWVDIDGKRLLRTDADSGKTAVWATPETPGFVLPTVKGGIVVGMETGLFSFAEEAGGFTRLIALDAPGMRFNDATTDDRGRIWTGTMTMGERRPDGVLYRIDPDLTMTPVITGLMTPNGLAVDGARGRLYLSDSNSDIQTVWTADLDMESGAVGEREVFLDMFGVTGRPDGATLDADGNYWLAGITGGVVYQLAPDGTVIAEFQVPSIDPTKPAFGGPALDRLFVTTRKSDGAPGGLFVADTIGVRGRAVPFFGAA